MTEFKRLGSEDLHVMHGLLDCFGKAFEEETTYGSNRPGADYLRNLLADETFIAIAAIHQGEIVGGLAAYELRKFEQERSEIYIYDLAVAEKFRRQGIATGLIEALQPIAQKKGAWVIFVQADYVDEPAVRLYEKLGKREEVLHFDIPVIRSGLSC